MNLLREYIRELLTEKDVLAIGMCFPFAIEKADAWWNEHYEKPADPENDYGIKHPDLNNMDKFKVVHGTVTNKWKKPSKPIVHAWVEMGDLVFDDQTKITKPNGVDKDFYYDMYQPEVVAEYTAEQALNKCAVSGYEGPWDEESLTSMRQRDAWLNDGLIREYTRLLSEKQVRDQKKKRVLYHIGPRPAKPMPMSRPYAQSWRRYWLDQGVESGVFFSPNPIDIAQYHGISGDVYAYKIPEWVIAKAGGVHRYDHGSEVLISADVWQEAGDEIEFLGKSMPEKELWEKIESLGTEPLRRSAGSRPGWMSDDEWEKASMNKTTQSHISGLRSTKHLKNAIRMMKPNERAEALTAFETIDVLRKKDYEIIDMIKSYMNESSLRGYIREMLESQPEEPDMTQYVDDLENEIFTMLFQKSTYDYLQSQDEGIESTMIMNTSLFDEYNNINEVHLGILVNDSESADVEAAYACVPEERNKSNLVLSINIPRNYPQVEGFQGWLSAELADSLSHEIQHSCDTSEMLAADIPEGEAKWESLENIEKYYASEAETRGHIAGMMGRARRTEQDPEKLLQHDVETVMMNALDKGYTKQEMIPVVQRIYDKWSERLGDRK